jgi:hypothetical protein
MDCRTSNDQAIFLHNATVPPFFSGPGWGRGKIAAYRRILQLSVGCIIRKDQDTLGHPVENDGAKYLMQQWGAISDHATPTVQVDCTHGNIDPPSLRPVGTSVGYLNPT